MSLAILASLSACTTAGEPRDPPNVDGRISLDGATQDVLFAATAHFGQIGNSTTGGLVFWDLYWYRDDGGRLTSSGTLYLTPDILVFRQGTREQWMPYSAVASVELNGVSSPGLLSGFTSRGKPVEHAIVFRTADDRGWQGWVFKLESAELAARAQAIAAAPVAQR